MVFFRFGWGVFSSFWVGIACIGINCITASSIRPYHSQNANALPINRFVKVCINREARSSGLLLDFHRTFDLLYCTESLLPEVVSEITPWLHLGGALKHAAAVPAKTTHGICAALERNVTPVP